jgi:undecaprenyl-diphosphatase
VDALQALVLGIVQGLTEFLPVSSSGHLVVVPAIFGWQEHGLGFDVLLHAATLLAVCFYFRRDLLAILTAMLSRDEARAHDRRLGWLIILGTIPAVVIGLALDDFFESLFEAPGPVGAFLVVTSAVLVAAERLSRVKRPEAAALAPRHALLVGLAQAAAIAPGISRAGSTIAAGLGVGLDREQAARFSFLLSVPIIAGTSAKTLLDAVTGDIVLPEALPLALGFVAAAVTGYLAIAGLLAYLRSRSLYVFSVYTAVAGVAVLVWQYVY